MPRGADDPAADGRLAGVMSTDQEFHLGSCLTDPDAEPCFKTQPRILTPDNTTGWGRFGEHQIFNALRFGLWAWRDRGRADHLDDAACASCCRRGRCRDP